MERTFADVDACYVLTAATDALDASLFPLAASLRPGVLHDGLATVRRAISLSDIPTALDIATIVLERAKTSGDASAVAEAYLSLALCYTALPFEEDSDRQEENQYSAIQCFKEALTIAESSGNSPAASLLRTFLGETYLRMPRASPEEAEFHLGYAVRYFASALKSPDARNELASRNYIGIAAAYLLHPAQLPENSLASVQSYCDSAATSLGSTRQSALLHTLKHLLLGMACYRHVLHRDKTIVLRAADHLQEALRACPEGGFRELKCRLATNLGHVWLFLENWSEALSAYRFALRWTLDSAGPGNPFRARPDSEASRNAAFCEAMIGDAERALRTLNDGRAKLIRQGFLEQLAASSGEAEQSIHHEARQALRRAQALLATSRPASGSLLAEIGGVHVFSHGQGEGHRARKVASEYASTSNEVRDRAQELGALMATLSRTLPALRNLPMTDDKSVSQLIDTDEAVVIPIVTWNGSLAILATSRGSATIELPALTATNLRAFIGQGEPESATSGYSTRSRWCWGYLAAYHSRNESPREWQAVLEHACIVLGEAFWRPILPHLSDGVSKIIIVPDGLLSMLPLSAAFVGEVNARRPLLADRAVSYIPTVSCLALATSLATHREERSLCCVVNPEEDSALDGTQFEAEAIQRLFSAKIVLEGRSATRTAVLNATGQFSHIHIASHGFYDWARVGRSGIGMSDAPITVEDIWSGLWDLRHARLVVLSACETGIVDAYSDASSEMPGLPGALMLAGVPAVVGTLWPVDDLATALVMSRFYEHHIEEGRDIPDALRRSQAWLREVTLPEVEATAATIGPKVANRSKQLRRDLSDEKRAAPDEVRPFEHPEFWAPFVCFGR